MKPVIGITMSFDNHRNMINDAYTNAVIQAGGIPVCLPLGIEKDIAQIVRMIDGMILSGGGDLHPHTFGEEPHPKLGSVNSARDRVELEMTREAVKLELPIFAICRGHQVLNVALGGTLFQDLYAQVQHHQLHSQTAPRYEGTHYVNIKQGSFLRKLVGSDTITVNSFHHQAIKLLAPQLSSVAKANDGIIEAVELMDYPFCLSVQWHPEELAVGGDEISKNMFKAFIEASSRTVSKI